MADAGFWLGSPTNELDRFLDEGPQTVVTISTGYRVGIHPGTQQEYQEVTGANPSSFTGDPSQPINQVSWGDATNYCAMLTPTTLGTKTTATATPHPVEHKLPNPRGLYDIYGNVWEWCQDWYADSNPGGALKDPHGPSAGSYRVLRGGSWSATYQTLCRSASRLADDPMDNFSTYGFRVVLAAVRP